MEQMVNEKEVYDALNEVEDPELGLGFVDLGLIYAVECDDDGNVAVTYSLTTPGCPIAGEVEGMIREGLYDVDGIGEVTATLSFSPAWKPEMMSEDAKFALGLL